MSQIVNAITKLTEEVNAASNPMYQVISEYLVDTMTEDSARKILTEGKTIAGAVSAMQAAAEKKRVGNCGVLSDNEGFRIVEEYFEISTTSSQPENTLYQRPASSTGKPSQPKTIDLMDLI